MLYYTKDAQGRIAMWADFNWLAGTPEEDSVHSTEQEIVYGPPEADGSRVGYIKGTEPATPPPTPEELRIQFDAAVTARLEEFAKTPYSEEQQPFDSMDRARAASMTTHYKAWGDIANEAYDMTWVAAEDLVPQVMDGTLTIDDALAQLPALSWTTT